MSTSDYLPHSCDAQWGQTIVQRRGCCFRARHSLHPRLDEGPRTSLSAWYCVRCTGTRKRMHQQPGAHQTEMIRTHLVTHLSLPPPLPKNFPHASVPMQNVCHSDWAPALCSDRSSEQSPPAYLRITSAPAGWRERKRVASKTLPSADSQQLCMRRCNASRSGAMCGRAS